MKYLHIVALIFSIISLVVAIKSRKKPVVEQSTPAVRMNNELSRHHIFALNPYGELEECSMSEEHFKKHKKSCFKKQDGKWVQKVSFIKQTEYPNYGYYEVCDCKLKTLCN